MSDAITTTARISLARSPTLRVGRLAIEPGTREIRHADGATKVLEPRVMQVLVALAEAPGRIVGRDELVARCWQREAVSEDAINRVVSRLRRVANDIGAGSFQVETISRVGYRLIALDDAEQPAVPPPQTLAVSPVAPITVAPRPDRLEPPPARGRRIDRGIVLAALALLPLAALVAILRPWRPAPSVPRDPRIVVQRLRTHAGDRDAQALSDGLSTVLARPIAHNDPTISVADPSDQPDQRAKADFVIAGEAGSGQGLLHVSVRLNGGSNAGILWSRDFERAVGEREALRQEIGARIADVLICAVAPQRDAARPLDDDSLRLFLAACEQRHTEFAAGAALFRRVVERRPDFAPAWARLAATTALAAVFGPPEQRRSSLRDAVASARRALAMKPDEGAAYLALVTADQVMADEGMAAWQRTHRLLVHGLTVAPRDPQLTLTAGGRFGQIGRGADARRYLRRAVELDPFAPIFVADLADALAFGGSPNEAFAILDDAARLWPGDTRTRFERLVITARIGDPATARRVLDAIVATRALTPREARLWRTLIDARADRSPKHAAEVTRELMAEAASADAETARFIIATLVQLDRVDLAYAVALRPGSATGGGEDQWFRGYMAPFRRDPRFMRVMAREGLVPVWRRTGLWPDFCRDEALPYDCRIAATAATRPFGAIPPRPAATSRRGTDRRARTA